MSLGAWPGLWGLHRRDRRRWERREQRREREQAIDAERLPDEEREWRRQERGQQAEIRREARRRLGWPEEEAHEDRLW